jgi:hypothetical protein
MKIKVVFASLAIATVVAAAFAFAPVKKTADAYGFTGTTNRLIQTGQTQSLVPSQMDVTSNWSSGLPSLTYQSDGAYFRAIVFNEEFDTDGGNDGELTLQEAVSAVRSYYASHSDLPQDGATISVSNANITIKRSPNN